MPRLSAPPPGSCAHAPVGRRQRRSYATTSSSSRVSSTGADRTIATRISKDHRGGNIGGSTFRLSLAALLLARLGLVAKAGHGRARLVDEKPLSTWIDTNCALTTATTAKPWTIEDAVIRELRAPLNLRPGYHPYRVVVHEARASLRRGCGL